MAKKKLISMDEALNHFDQIIIKTEFEKWLSNGGFILLEHIVDISEIRMDRLDQIVKVKNSKGEILSIARQALGNENNIIFT